ncbi:MAG: carotenoid oxygenase family protein [Halieaceae bacterium]|jgi:carotenoid cleavage dioxygenase|nr:carotenoid oxygenase family protein [Halieaceae bacterium]
MDRRDFLKSLAMLASGSALMPYGVLAAPGDWRLAFEGVTQDLPDTPMQVEGVIPEECYGTLYRNGPALYQRGEQRYQHWFDPDGMVQAYRLGADGVSHAGRFVRTQKFLQESAAGRFLFDGAGSKFADSLPARNNESGNVANINVQPFNGELLALWEAGSPYRMDPDSLDTLGQQYWLPELKGVPFSAHPHVDGTGDMWNIGAAPWASRPTLALYHIGKKGQLKKYRMQQLPEMGYIHDFVLTPRYLVVLNSSSIMGVGETFVGSMHWTPTRPSELLFFDRNDFSLVKTLDVPATFVFHFGNGWEQAGRICFTACEYRNDSIATRAMYHLVRGAPTAQLPESRLVRYAVDLAAGTVQKTDLELPFEFPSYDRRRPFQAQQLYGVAGGDSGSAGLSGEIACIDPRTGKRDSFRYGDHVIVEEPQLVFGRSGAFVVHSYLDTHNGQTGLAILRAGNLSDGPVARATMDRIVPPGFHGCFLPKA